MDSTEKYTEFKGFVTWMSRRKRRTMPWSEGNRKWKLDCFHVSGTVPCPLTNLWMSTNVPVQHALINVKHQVPNNWITGNYFLLIWLVQDKTKHFLRNCPSWGFILDIANKVSAVRASCPEYFIVWCEKLVFLAEFGSLNGRFFSPFFASADIIIVTWTFRLSVCVWSCGVACFRSPRLTLALCLAEALVQRLRTPARRWWEWLPSQECEECLVPGLPGLGGSAPGWG